MMGTSAFPNPALDLVDNAVEFVAYAINQGYPQTSIDGRVDQLVKYLGAMKSDRRTEGG